MWDLNTGSDITFQNVFIHPLFEPSPLYDDYDMAILELTHPIPIFSNNVVPICVPWISKFKDQNQNDKIDIIIISREKLQWITWSDCWLGYNG